MAGRYANHPDHLATYRGSVTAAGRSQGAVVHAREQAQRAAPLRARDQAQAPVRSRDQITRDYRQDAVNSRFGNAPLSYPSSSQRFEALHSQVPQANSSLMYTGRGRSPPRSGHPKPLMSSSVHPTPLMSSRRGADSWFDQDREDKLLKLEHLSRREKELHDRERMLKEELRRKEDQRRESELRRKEEEREDELRRKEEAARRRNEDRLRQIKEKEKELADQEQRLLRMEAEARKIDNMRLLDEQRRSNEKINRMERERAERMMNQRHGSDPAGIVHQSWHDTRPAVLPLMAVNPMVNLGTQMDMNMRMNINQAARNRGGILPVPDNVRRNGGIRNPQGLLPKPPRVNGAVGVKRGSAFNRLGGAKKSVKERLGAGARNTASRIGNNMSITVQSHSSKRSVNTSGGGGPKRMKFEPTKKGPSAEVERKEIMERERKLKERLLREEKERSSKGVKGEADNIVIKKIAGKKAVAGAGTTVAKNWGARMALKLKEMPQPAVEPKTKTVEEKSAIKTKIFAKFGSSPLPNRLLVVALQNVKFDEERAVLLLNKVINEDAVKVPEVIDLDFDDVDVELNVDDRDKLDYEAED